MKRVNLVYKHPVFQQKFQALQEAERERLFCRHTMEHLIDVARLMYIYALEHELSISKEMIYATALMHDIGRIDQIEKGVPHEQAGVLLCDTILPECGFSKEEIETIKTAVLHHRTASKDEKNTFSDMLYWADKKSRNCFACSAQKECNWAEEKMNLNIEY